jgi:hypothetical protein
MLLVLSRVCEISDNDSDSDSDNDSEDHGAKCELERCQRFSWQNIATFDAMQEELYDTCGQ